MRGASLVGLLVTLGVIGILAAAIPVLTSGSNGKSGIPNLTIPVTGRTAGGQMSAAGSDIAGAEAVACRATYGAALVAVGTYEAETGSRPTSISQVQPLLRDPLSSAFFTIEIDPRKPGQLQVAAHDHPAAGGDANCAAAGT